MNLSFLKVNQQKRLQAKRTSGRQLGSKNFHILFSNWFQEPPHETSGPYF